MLLVRGYAEQQLAQNACFPKVLFLSTFCSVEGTFMKYVVAEGELGGSVLWSPVPIHVHLVMPV